MGLNATLFERLETVWGELPEAVKRELERQGYADAYENALNDGERQEVVDLAVAYLKRRGVRRSRGSQRIRYSSQDTSPAAKAFAAIQYGAVEAILRSPEEQLAPSERGLRRAILAFRQAYLPEGLIAPESIPDWLREHNNLALRESHLELSLTPEQRNALLQWLFSGQCEFTLTFEREQLRGLRENLPVLAYGGQVYAVPLELRYTVDAVSGYTGWSIAQSIEYLLAGVLPDGIPLDASVCASPDAPATITLRVPIAMRPETVAQVYASFRKGKRLRSVSRKQAELVRFVEVYRTQFPRAKWCEIAQAWNKHCEEQGFPESWCVRAAVLRSTYNRTVRAVFRVMTEYTPPQGSRWTVLVNQGIY